jgi:hypothetical protein
MSTAPGAKLQPLASRSQIWCELNMPVAVHRRVEPCLRSARSCYTILAPIATLSALSCVLLCCSLAYGSLWESYRHADNSRPVSITVSAWERVYAMKLSRLQRETREREREKQANGTWQKHTEY